MAVWFPDGISNRMIVPGGYAIVGKIDLLTKANTI